MNDIVAAVEKHTQLILDAERYIWQNPETGYKEFKTSAYMAEAFKSLGYELVMADGITGFYTVIDTGKPGPKLLILGEMDSIICPQHKEADKQTGAVHSCGHHAQCAALIGVAAALKEPGILDGLCGKIMLCAVPAEELLEIDFRANLKREGKIKYFGGKSEFMSRGYFDDVDLAFMVHATVGTDFIVRNGFVGCLAKQITFKGAAAHAGGAPWNGKNALYAANCGLNAINAIRETFKESDIIRVHPIITSGGAMVNAIPDTVTLESYVRGATFEGICNANKKVNQALCGAALSIGTNVDITDIPGYAPEYNNMDLIELTEKAAAAVIPHRNFVHHNVMSSGSTDMGDLSCVMPVVHPYACGAQGTAHGSDYYLVDPVAACVDNAKLQLAMLRMLLSDNAKAAKDIISNFKPQFPSIADYLSYVDSLNTSGDRIEYLQDGTAKIKLD